MTDRDLRDGPLLDAAVGVRGDELERLLAPVGAARFAAEYWGARPLYIEGAADKYAGLFDRDAFLRAVAAGPSAPAERGFHVRARFDRRGQQGELVPELPIGPAHVADALRGGATICVNAIDAGDVRLATFAHAIKAQLGYPGQVRFNAYLSPDGCGAKVHFDARIATTLQIAGAKRWRYSKQAAVTWPRGNGLYHPDGTGSYHFVGHGDAAWEQIARLPEAEFEEVVLEPGDFLCLPAGTWHACEARGESLALNLAFERVSPLEVVVAALEEQLEEAPAWRSAAPAPVGRDGEVPDDLDRYLEARLDELARTVAALRADPTPLRHAWCRATVAPQVRAPVRRSGQDARAAPPIGPERWLGVHRALSPVWTRGRDGDGAPTVTLWAGEARIEVGEGAAALVLGALRARRFRAHECLVWTRPADRLTWSDVQETLALLVASGVLEILD